MSLESQNTQAVYTSTVTYVPNTAYFAVPDKIAVDKQFVYFVSA